MQFRAFIYVWRITLVILLYWLCSTLESFQKERFVMELRNTTSRFHLNAQASFFSSETDRGELLHIPEDDYNYSENR